jgi:LytS/YehU family sensor histidine kinase
MLVTPLSPLPEAAPLLALRLDAVLPFLREEVFDEFVSLAARIFSLPISLFNVVDAHQVKTEAQCGMPDATPQLRTNMLCSLVVEQNHMVVYYDLTTVPQTSSNASAIRSALAKSIRFYAAAPVRLNLQDSMGTLCLLDQQPREFTTEEQHVLQALADTISQTIVVRSYYLTTPGLGEAHWQHLRLKVHDEVHALAALVRYLLTRYGALVPVPEDVLHLVLRRLADLRILLQNKE